MDKVWWLDTETTGLDPAKNALIEIAGLIEIGDKLEEEFVINSGLFAGQEISEGAARLQGLSVDQFAERIDSYQAPLMAYRELKGILDRHIDKYDKADKLIVSGYNIGFDISFLEAFFRRMEDNYLYSYIHSPVDIMSVTRFLSMMGIVRMENHKLGTVCDAFGIPLVAHHALDDIRATREIALRVKSLLNGDMRGEI